jgi:hypothetical protein
MFQAEIAQLVALAILMPIVSSLGGNAGTQTLAVAVRALASKELTTANARRIVLRELIGGLVNGLCLALVMGTATYLFFGTKDHHGKLAIIVGRPDRQYLHRRRRGRHPGAAGPGEDGPRPGGVVIDLRDLPDRLHGLLRRAADRALLLH